MRTGAVGTLNVDNTETVADGSRTLGYAEIHGRRHKPSG